jgi:hypothetical protein
MSPFAPRKECFAQPKQHQQLVKSAKVTACSAKDCVAESYFRGAKDYFEQIDAIRLQSCPNEFRFDSIFLGGVKP